MADVKLANSVVRSLSEYLTYKAVAGPKAFSGSLEELLGEVESRLSDPYGEEIISRFKEAPGGNVEADTLRLHLGQAIARDPDFARRLASVLAGRKAGRRGGQLAVAAVLAVVVLGASFVLGRVTAGGSDTRAAPVTVTSTVDHTVTETPTPSGEAKPLTAELPPNVFTLTLRMSLTKIDTPECVRGNAVWGSPYVVAAGS